jgi:hypothetical protein
VAPSSFEVKYHALMEGTKKIVWLQKLLSEIKHLKPRSTIVTILVVLKLPKILFFMPLPNISNVITTSWERRFEEIAIRHIPSTQQQANILMKPLGKTKFEDLP